MPRLLELPVNGKGKYISHFQASQIYEQTPQSEIETAGDYEFMRTKNFVIYHDNRKIRARHKTKMYRIASQIARITGKSVKLDPKNRFLMGKNIFIQFADMIDNMAEFEHHLEKGQVNAASYLVDFEDVEIVSLKKSELASYVKLDNKPIADYYQNDFEFPEWFKPFLKQRHIRFMGMKQNFEFANFSYAYETGLKKFRNDVKRLDTGKIYISLARMLAHNEEKTGEGKPIDLLLKALDVDADSHEGLHKINSSGLCSECIKTSKQKLRLAQFAFEKKPEKVLFSGTKGFHLHWLEEINEVDMIGLIEDVNRYTKLVDDFTFKDNGVKKFDMHRIFKLPNTIDATTCIKVADKLERIDVKDDVLDPHMEVSCLDRL